MTAQPKPKVFKRSDIEKSNRISRERRKLQEEYDNARRERLNKTKKYV